MCLLFGGQLDLPGHPYTRGETRGHITLQEELTLKFHICLRRVDTPWTLNYEGLTPLSPEQNDFHVSG
jgi:hypothetical protein